MSCVMDTESALLTKLHFYNVASGGLGCVRARFQHVQCVCGKCCGRPGRPETQGAGKRSVRLHFQIKHANSEEKRPSVTIDGRSQKACFLFLALLHSQCGCKQGACRYQQRGDCNDWRIAVTRMRGGCCFFVVCGGLIARVGIAALCWLGVFNGAVFSV